MTAEGGSALGQTIDQVDAQTARLTVSANGFARAMATAFTTAASGGKQLDDVLKTLVLRLSSLTVSSALKPLVSGLTGGLNQLLSGSVSGVNVMAAKGAIKPFAAGGVIGTPTYFPLQAGGLGLAGEAGPEAIMPLARGSDGSLGMTMNGSGGGANVTIHIATPDADSFRRSESYLTGQIARAVMRGQRSL